MGTKRDRRRSEAIHFYAGSNGGGKTLCAVYDTIPSLLSGRPVLSTVRILDPDRRAESLDVARTAWSAHGIEDHEYTHVDPLALPHPLYVRWTNWHQLMGWSFGDVIADEVQGIISSRGHGSTPSAVVNAMQQLRRGDVMFRATAPSFARMDVAVREVTQALTLCSGYLGVTVPGRLWSASRLLLWRTYNARDYDEWDASRKDDKVRFPRSVRQWFWRPRHLDVTAYYDTFAPVDVIATATEGGSCLYCGGARTRPRCSCPPDGLAGEAVASASAPRPSLHAIESRIDHG